MIVKEAYEAFLFDKQAENLTDKTIQSYTDILRLFVAYAGLGYSTDILDADIVKRYIIHLRKRELSGRTIYTYVKHIKVFYKWLYGENHCIAGLRIKYEKHLPEILTHEEMERLIEIQSLRDRLLVCLVLDCGLRKAELSRVKQTDISGGRLFVHLGKGRKDRVVPLSAHMLHMLDDYLKTRSGQTDFLFETSKGTPLSYNAIRAVFRRLQDKTGISRLTPHLLRHTYGTYYIDNGGDIKTLQILMGHSEVKTTETYIHLAGNLHVEKYAKYSIFNVLSNKKDSP